MVEVEGKPEKEVSTLVDIDVQAATPERVTTLRRRLERSPDLPPLDTGEERPENWIYGTRHRALVPFALRRFEGGDTFCDSQMLDFCYYLSDAPEEVHAHMVALACKPSWKPRVALFDYWRDRGYDDPKAADERPGFPDFFDYQYWPTHRTPLPPQEFSKLLRAKSFWTRVLTDVAFPARCSEEWKRGLLEDCRQRTQPLPASQLAPMLRDLNDDDFAVREKASAQLKELGERVEPQLKQALLSSLSAEAKRRVLFLLEEIAAGQKTPEWKPVLDYLSSGNRDSDTACAVLHALAKGRADASLTKAAVASLNKLTASK